MKTDTLPGITRTSLTLTSLILRKLRSIISLSSKVGLGGYNKDDLASLKSLILFVNTKLEVSDKLISQQCSTSADVIRNIKGGGNPRLENFLSIATGVRAIMEDELIERGVMSRISRAKEGPLLVSTHVLTERGKILSLIDDLENFKREFRSINDIEEYVTPEYREQLIALLENLIAQLKTPLVDVHTVDLVSNEITDLGKNVVDKLRDRGSEATVNLIVRLISSIFG